MAAKTDPRESCEKNLLQAPAFPAELVANLPAIVWTTDAQFYVTSLAGGEFNSSVLNPASYLHTPVSALFRAQDSASKVEDAHYLASLGESCTFDFELDGRDFHAHVAPIRGENARVIGVVGIAVDHTDRLVAQRALRMSEQNYRLLIEEAPHAICRCTTSGSLLQVNRAMQEMLAYPEPDLLVLNLQNEVFADAEQYANFVRQLLTQPSVYAFAGQWLGAGRRLLQVSLGGRAVRDNAGEVLYLDLFAENVTERRQLEEQLRQAQKMQAIGQLAGGIAHDFNNLLTVIRGQAEMMSEEMLASDPLAPRLEDLERAAERATSLTRQLLAFSRKQVLQTRVTDLNTTVAGVTQLLSRLIGGNIELVFKPDPDLWPVKVDPAQIEQVLMNLAVNARDAMPEGGTLIIETQNSDSSPAVPAELSSHNYICLTVTDTGHGMDEATRGRIFEPFFTTKQVGKGTGLGLAVVYGVIKQSGGNIAVESNPGAGTSFRILLPAIEAVPESTPHSVHGKICGGSETILLAEDDEAIRHMLSLFLRNHGYHVLLACDGEQAEQIVATEKVDLLLSDVMMPRRSGRELVTRLKAIAPGLRAILMSGHTEDPQACPEGVSFVQKPFSMHTLAAVLRKVLEEKRGEARAASAGLD